MILIASSWSGSPHVPNIIVPRQSGLTCIPVRPRLRYSITPTERPDSGDPSRRPARGSGDPIAYSRRSRFRNPDCLLVNTAVDETGHCRALSAAVPHADRPRRAAEALAIAFIGVPMAYALPRRRP